MDNRPDPEPIDLRPITRDTDRMYCLVQIGYRKKTWIECGGASIQKTGDTWVLKAYLPDGVTDREHDSAYALYLPLVGLQYEFTHHNVSFFHAWIDPSDPESFHVPGPDYNPMELESATICDSPHCRRGERHFIVEHYTPPPNLKLFRQVAGRKVEIIISHPPRDDE